MIETRHVNLKKRRVISVLKQNYIAWLIMVPSLLLFLVAVWQPLVSGVVLSFFKTQGFEPVKFIGLENYKNVISDSIFKKEVINTITFVLWSLVLGFLLPIIMALIINEMVHFKSFFKFAVYFPTMVPGIAVALLWTLIYDPGQGGLLNAMMAHLGLGHSQWLQDSRLTIPLIVVSMVWKSAGGTTILYLASLQGVNQELYEAAAIDGANIWTKTRKIAIPQISGTIALCFILQIIAVFQTMIEPLTMTDGGPNNASMTLMLQSYFDAFRYGDAGKSIALSVITFIILVIFTLIYFKINNSSEE